MALRLYLWNSSAPYTPATVRGAWDATASAVAKALYPGGKSPTQTMTNVGVAETSTTDNWDVLLGRFVSPPLDAQTISGTLTGYLVAWESNAAANDLLHIHLYVTQGDSDTPRGTLLTDYVGSEFYTSRRGISIGSQSLSSLAVSAGDRLVLEVGYRANNTSATSYTGSIVYGALSSSVSNPDASDETTTFTSDALSAIPWIEFSSLSMTLAGQLQVSQLAVEAANYDAATGVQLQVSQLASEAASHQAGTVEVRASQLVPEVISEGTNIEVRVSQFVIETGSELEPVVRSPGAGMLVLAGDSPVLLTTLPLSPASGELVLSGNAPVLPVTVAPGEGTLVLTGSLQETPTVGAGGELRSPDAGTLTLEGNTPSVSTALVLVPSSGTIRVVGSPAVVSTSVTIRPASGTLILEGNVPTLFAYPVALIISQLAVEVSSQQGATGVQLQTSQLASEVSSYQTDPAAIRMDVSQLATEASSYQPSMGVRLSQLAAEVMSYQDAPAARLSQHLAEVIAGPSQWVDVADYVRVSLNSEDFSYSVGCVQIQIWADSPTAMVKARLFNITTSTSAGEGTFVLASTPTRYKFGAALAAGVNLYKLQITATENGVDLFAIGYVRPVYYPGEVGVVEETPPVPPYEPPAGPTPPAWWLPWGSGISLPEGKGTFHYGSGGFNDYRWTGITAIVGGYESTMAFGGDLHGDVDPNIGAMITWMGVTGATAYRIYVFNAVNESGLFDPHTNITNLVSADDGPMVIQFKEVPATPNWGGWPPESEWAPDPPPEYEGVFLGDSDGTQWTQWPL